MKLEGRSNLVLRRDEEQRPPPLVDETSWSARLRRVVDLMSSSVYRDVARLLPTARGTVLDVGCGGQPYRKLVPRECRYLAIDHSSSREFGYAAPDTSYYDGTTWPVPDRAADLVLCTEVLEHVEDSSAFLAEMFRCTAPGGTAILTVPFAARWHFIPRDFWRFTPASLKLLLEKAGFADVRVHARGDHVTVACYKAIAVVLRLLFPRGRGLAVGCALRLLGLLSLPAVAPLAALGHLTLGHEGDDCLGYTVLATRPPA